MRKADQIGVNYEQLNLESIEQLKESETGLIFTLNEFEKKIKLAGEEYSPAVIAQYLFDLAKDYNRFYADVAIFQEENPVLVSFRVALSELTAKTIKKGMSFLGIDVPNRM